MSEDPQPYKKPRKVREVKPKSKPPERNEHAVVDGDTLKCLRCQETDKLPINVSIDYLIKRIQLFTEEHHDCRKPIVKEE